MRLRVEPIESFTGTFRVPASKPETQRAILASALAEGRSRPPCPARAGPSCDAGRWRL